jgi:hypothetical protein
LELVRAIVIPITAARAAGEATIMATQTGGPLLHVRFDGRSRDVALAELDVGPMSSDGAIKAALARYLEVPEARLRDYVIDRHETGNVTVRPEAVFGYRERTNPYPTAEAYKHV